MKDPGRYAFIKRSLEVHLLRKLFVSNASMALTLFCYAGVAHAQSDCNAGAFDTVAGLALDQGVVRVISAEPFSTIVVDGQEFATVDATGEARLVLSSGPREIVVIKPINDDRQLVVSERVIVQAGQLFCFQSVQLEQWTKAGLKSAYTDFKNRTRDEMQDISYFAQAQIFYQNGAYRMFRAFPNTGPESVHASPDNNFRGYNHFLEESFPDSSNRHELSMATLLDMCPRARNGHSAGSLGDRELREIISTQAAGKFLSSDVWADASQRRVEIFRELYQYHIDSDGNLPFDYNLSVPISWWDASSAETVSWTKQAIFEKLLPELIVATGLREAEALEFAQSAIYLIPTISFPIYPGAMFDTAIAPKLAWEKLSELNEVKAEWEEMGMWDGADRTYLSDINFYGGEGGNAIQILIAEILDEVGREELSEQCDAYHQMLTRFAGVARIELP